MRLDVLGCVMVGLLAAVVLAVVGFVGTGIGVEVFGWGVTRQTVCLTPAYVDIGEGFGHSAAIYSDRGAFQPDQDVIGQLHVGQRACVVVRHAWLEDHDRIVSVEGGRR